MLSSKEDPPVSSLDEMDTPTDTRSSSPEPPEKPLTKETLSRFQDDVRTSIFVEIQLLILTFCTGIQDATSFPDYHCFASNQTGNTVFLCVAIIIPSFNGEMFFTGNIGMALGLFLGAGWLTGQLSHIIGPRKRWWLILCNLIQTAFVFAAAGVQCHYGVQQHGPMALLVIGLMAFASGSQVVQSRSLAATEISTAMATAAWVDLVIDPKLFVLNNRPRTRRVMFILALVAGSLVGAAIYRRVGSAAAIFVSAGGKLLVTLMYIFSEAVQRKLDISVV